MAEEISVERNRLPVTAPFDKHAASMSIDRIHEKVLELLLAEPGWRSWTRYLDIGAGRGTLIAR
jgi:hypothetical protein